MDSGKKRLNFRWFPVPTLILSVAFLSYWWIFTPGQKAENALRNSAWMQAEAATVPEPKTLRVEDTIQRNATLATVLGRFDFGPPDIYRLIEDTQSVYNLHQIRAGNRIVLERFLDGSFRAMEYHIDDEEYLLVSSEPDGYVASRHQHPFELVEEEFYGQIQTSLWNTLISQGEKAALVDTLFHIFAWDINFTEIQPNDSVKLIMKKKYQKERDFFVYGDIEAVHFEHEGKPFQAFLFENPETGKKEHFDREGNSVKKELLKVPFNYNPRITSGFTYSRFHPILKKRRPHLGVDYGAPVGTPVKAAGGGRVIFAGRNGGYGKMVKIRHPNGFMTSYSHLSRIQVRRGVQVQQGIVIGKVGSTGLSTGPHLDYRVQNKRGKYLNPRKLTSLPVKPLPPKHMKSFESVRDALLERLESIAEHEPRMKRVADSRMKRVADSR